MVPATAAAAGTAVALGAVVAVAGCISVGVAAAAAAVAGAAAVLSAGELAAPGGPLRSGRCGLTLISATSSSPSAGDVVASGRCHISRVYDDTGDPWARGGCHARASSQGSTSAASDVPRPPAGEAEVPGAADASISRGGAGWSGWQQNASWLQASPSQPLNRASSSSKMIAPVREGVHGDDRCPNGWNAPRLETDFTTSGSTPPSADAGVPRRTAVSAEFQTKSTTSSQMMGAGSPTQL